MPPSRRCPLFTRRRPSLVLGGLVLLGAAGSAPADDLMRCGSVLITLGMVAPQVLAKCGPPKDKSVTEVPNRVRRANGNIATTGSSRIERWTYDRGYGQFPAVLTFEGGRLKSIQLLTR